MKKSKTAVKSQPLGKKKDTRGIKYFLWILPFLILVFLFSYFPLHGWIYSFYDYRPPRSLADCEFVGLQWFKMLFKNKTQVSQLIQVMKNTFVMRLLGIATSILPVGFAIFLNEIKCKWFKTFVQTFTTLPNFISWVLVSSVAFSLFSSTGMINGLLENLGIITEPIKFLDSDSHTYLWMLLWNIWKGLGWGAIMYLASIASIDQEQYEAAEIDGAGIFKVFYKIVLPACTPILATVSIFSAVGQWNSYQDTLIYVTEQKLYSLQYLLYTYINQASSLAAMVKNSGTAAISSAALATQQTGTSIRMTVSVSGIHFAQKFTVKC